MHIKMVQENTHFPRNNRIFKFFILTCPACLFEFLSWTTVCIYYRINPVDGASGAVNRQSSGEAHTITYTYMYIELDHDCDLEQDLHPDFDLNLDMTLTHTLTLTLISTLNLTLKMTLNL